METSVIKTSQPWWTPPLKVFSSYSICCPPHSHPSLLSSHAPCARAGKRPWQEEEDEEEEKEPHPAFICAEQKKKKNGCIFKIVADKLKPLLKHYAALKSITLWPDRTGSLNRTLIYLTQLGYIHPLKWPPGVRQRSGYMDELNRWSHIQ